MGREVRRVPANWQHPKNEHGHYVAMYDRNPYDASEIEEGIRDGWLDADAPNYGLDVMPDWPAEERTHVQMYENTSEGTPISPVMESPEALARWLVDNNASAFADMTAPYEAWLRIAQGGYAPSAVSIGGGPLVSGVEALSHDSATPKD